MRTIHCSLDYCKTECITLQEMVMGLCDRHLSLLADRHHYIGVCWNCNRITLIQEVPRSLRDVFNDKYLFTKACSHCTGNLQDDVRWVTFKRFMPELRTVIGVDGKLKMEKISPPKENKLKDRLPSLDDPLVEDVKVAESHPSVEDGAETELRDLETGQN